MMKTKLPFVDLKAQYKSIKNELDEAILQCIEDADFIKGSVVERFENDFASYIGADHCISCANGTDALEMILKALGIGRGDEVIVPAISWISTAECVSNTGAEPVFVDVNPLDCLIDPSLIEEKITPVTKAIIPVHIYGNPADMHSIIEVAKKYNLFVIEDCAQSHGAEIKGRKTGTFGIASAFSFFPSKNLGAFGDAGAVITNNPELAEKIRMLSNHGQLKVKHKHKIIGRNSRMDSLQAAVLQIKLKYLDNWNMKRISAAEQYISHLSNNRKFTLPVIRPYHKHVFHLFVIQCSNREHVINDLDAHGISYGIHYPHPMPFLEAYGYKNLTPGDFPAASVVTGKILSLPIYPEITPEQIKKVCDSLS